jgi:hypothetical protein
MGTAFFLTAISKGLNLRMEKLKTNLYHFVISNEAKYKQFLPLDWKVQLGNYLFDKKWNCDLMDTIPSIIADMLNVKITIITNGNGKIIQTVLNSTGNKLILLILEGGHYTYCDLNEVTHEFRDWFFTTSATSLSKKQCVTEETKTGVEGESKNINKSFRKPTISLNFKSDVTTKHITNFKNNLCIAKEFNMVFRSHARMLDVVRNARRKTLPISPVIDDGTQELVPKTTLLDKHGVVYQATCSICKSEGTTTRYIGETGRALGIRIKEHCQSIPPEKLNAESNSALGYHCCTTHGSQPSKEKWELKVLHTSNRSQDRKTLEAMEIRRVCPELNRDKGVNVILQEVVNF